VQHVRSGSSDGPRLSRRIRLAAARDVKLAKIRDICEAVHRVFGQCGIERNHQIGRKATMVFGRLKQSLLICITVLGVVPFCGSSALAQQSTITVDGDIRLFTVLSALDAAGMEFSRATNSSTMEWRRQVRSVIDQKLSEDLNGRLKEFVETHRGGNDRSAEISKYISLALVLGQPPKFGFVWSREKLPPDVLAIADFEPLVKEFYEAIRIETLWSRAQPALDSIIERYQDPIMQTIQQTEGYLRLPSYSYLGRHYYIALDLIGVSSAPAARNYGEDYYLVVRPSAQPDLDEIRHQFLHFVLDPLSMKFADRFHHKQSLLEVAASNSNLDVQFKKDFMLFANECLIRAAELRLRKLPAAKVEVELARNAASGFFLIRHFYTQFQEFEKGEQGIREALGDMVEAIDIVAAQKYAASLALVQLPTPPAAPKAVRSEGEIKLNEAEDLLSEEKYEAAKKIFKQLAASDESVRARALYGLGVASSLQRNQEDAVSYFQQALAIANVDNATKAWSHIYLGRLRDLEGDREGAIREYAAAVQTKDDARGAQAAAKRGLERPFTGKDREQ
jgi:hypothetical protein